MTKIFAYVRKSFLTLTSYRFAFVLGIANPVFFLFIIFFVDKLFAHQIVPHLVPFGVNYFSYLLVSIMASGFLGGSMSATARQISQDQMMGTLESLLVTPTSIYTIIVAMVAWNLISAIFNILIYTIAGIFIFGANFRNINLLSTTVITILSMISFNALGVLSTSFIIAFKRGDPVSYLMNLGMELLGGVFFPVTLLPNWLQILSYFFPITYAIRALEQAIYQGASLRILWQDVTVLLIISAILIPLAYWSLKTSLNYARKRGTLLQY